MILFAVLWNYVFGIPALVELTLWKIFSSHQLAGLCEIEHKHAVGFFNSYLIVLMYLRMWQLILRPIVDDGVFFGNGS